MKDLVKRRSASARGSKSSTITDNWVTRNPKLSIAGLGLLSFVVYKVITKKVTSIPTVDVALQVNNNLRVPLEQIGAVGVMGG